MKLLFVLTNGLDTRLVTLFEDWNGAQTLEPVSCDPIRQVLLTSFSFVAGTSWEKELDITAADGPQLNDLFHLGFVSYNASNGLLVIFMRAVARFQSKRELIKQTSSKLIFLSTNVVLYCDPSHSASLFPVIAVDDASNGRFECWGSFLLQPWHIPNSSLLLSSDSNSATNLAKKKVDISTAGIAESYFSFSSSSFETIMKKKELCVSTRIE